MSNCKTGRASFYVSDSVYSKSRCKGKSTICLPVYESSFPHFFRVVEAGFFTIENEGSVALRDLVTQLGQEQVLHQSLVVATFPETLV
jgi:hypothetical protein